MSELLTFAPPPATAACGHGPAWKILMVDDDREVHAVTHLMLKDFSFEGRGLELLSAGSAAMARRLLEDEADIALVLLDVVMESDDAGLELVRHIREARADALTRIVLRTGQLGLAPVQAVAANYQIDDYLNKSELTFSRLRTLVTTSLRTWALLQRLSSTQRELESANQELHQLAYTDPLTGLLNRRLFGFSVEREWRRAMREQLPVCALMMDVDHFKLFNDAYGHPAGDAALCQVAGVLAARCARAGDVLCRYGGEEFLAVCAGLGAAEGQALAGRIVAEVAALGLPHAASPHQRLSLSLGGAVLQGHPAAGLEGYQALIEQADQALYRAKRAGRNRMDWAALA